MEVHQRRYEIGYTSITMFVLYIFIICLGALVVKYVWSRRKLYSAARKLPGEIAFPLIGASWVFWNSSDIVFIISKLVRKFGTPFGFWLGTRFVIYLSEPEHADIIINSSNSMDKGGFYTYIQDMIGGPGLFSSGGDYWKMHRRLLNPTVQNYKILNSFYPCINECLQVLVKRLEDKCGKGIFNIYDYMEACSFDMFVKNTFGVDLNVQKNENVNILNMVNDALHVVGIKVFQPWYQFEPLFRLTKYSEIKKRTTADLRLFIKEVLRKRIVELNSSNVCEKEDDSTKRLRIFIDEIINLAVEEKCFSEEEMISESLTMLMAGYETTAVTVSNIIVMLSLHPEYQEMAYQEIRTIFPHDDTPVTAEDINQLQFTDRLIKETMRLAPTVPFIGRQAKADFYVGKLFVPAETELIVSLFELQRNKMIWGEDAAEFNPDHFLPENVETKHAYSFIPYSAGTRNCIGKKYAQIVIKMFIVWLLRNYAFSTDLKYEELRYNWMIVMKLKSGYPVKIEKRKNQ